MCNLMISVFTKMLYQEVREIFSKVREKSGKMKVEKSGHPVEGIKSALASNLSSSTV